MAFTLCREAKCKQSFVIIISKAWKRVSVSKVPVGRPRWGWEEELRIEMVPFLSNLQPQMQVTRGRSLGSKPVLMHWAI